ncbi:hypothetical protein GCM10027067_17080 [Pseudactinotalea suaedae]
MRRRVGGDPGRDGVASLDREGAALAEGRLHVDDEEGAVGRGVELHRRPDLPVASYVGSKGFLRAYDATSGG